jgi:hypothetical protein
LFAFQRVKQGLALKKRVLSYYFSLMACCNGFGHEGLGPAIHRWRQGGQGVGWSKVPHFLGLIPYFFVVLRTQTRQPKHLQRLGFVKNNTASETF